MAHDIMISSCPNLRMLLIIGGVVLGLGCLRKRT